jgi:S-DNA-T family DNA segregation ATPase FtsK/SpoIIIE
MRMLSDTHKTSFLPAGVRDKLGRAGLAALGFMLFLAAGYILAALSSHHPGDPSWNTATAARPQNLMGLGGAVLSDALLQGLGIAGGLLVPLLAAWGGLLLRGRRIVRIWIRICFLLPVLALAAAVFSAAAPGLLDGISAGSGGVLGGILAGGAAAMVGKAGALPGFAVWLPSAVAVAALFLWLLGFSLADWRTAVLWCWRGIRRGTVAAYRRAADYLAWPGYDDEPADYRDDFIEEAFEPDADPEPAAAPLAKPKRAPRASKLVAPKTARSKPGRKALEAREPRLDLEARRGRFQLPPLHILQDPPTGAQRSAVNEQGLEQNARLLESVLQDFGVRGEIVKVRPGPVVTLYELEPAPGTKTSRVIGLSDDIARSMSAVSVRIATVPGRSVIGIELPNHERDTVLLRELLSSNDFEKAKDKLPLVLGKNIGGAPIIADLAKMPHLLIAGTTGSGKSVGLNAMILSLLYRHTPQNCRFIMIDPKMLELSIYNDIPHLLAPVVTDPKKAVVALKWTVREMEDRYQAMSKLGVRNVEGYNKRVAEAAHKGEVLTRKVQTGFDPETGKAVYEEQELDLAPLPFIVVVVDEMADLMLVAGKDIEASIQRLAQMARAAGIHLIMATQRPSVDVITGTIKANFPTRISFQVTSKVDSRTILGEQGAEQLLGMGDMLYSAPGGQLNRVHGPFVSDEEVEAVADHLRAQEQPLYNETVTEEPEDGDFGALGGGGSEGDDLYDKAVALVCQEQKASTSFIQRHLQIGYNRAARIMEQMEKQGVVSAANHVGKREILAGSH